MNYWIFKANPEKYRIDERLLEPYPFITWAVTRYHERIQKDDVVFVWRAGKQRGICAVMTVEACPFQPEPGDLNDGFELPLGSVLTGSDHWAKCRITRRFALIEAGVIKKIPGLELFSFFSAFQQATNYTVFRPEGTILMEFIEKHQADALTRPPEKISKPAPRVRTASPARAASDKKGKPSAPASSSSAVSLLKCDGCGRYVVSTDTERHVREMHAGQMVEWKKTK
jgi:hypothetical protein